MVFSEIVHFIRIHTINVLSVRTEKRWLAVGGGEGLEDRMESTLRRRLHRGLLGWMTTSTETHFENGFTSDLDR